MIKNLEPSKEEELMVRNIKIVVIAAERINKLKEKKMATLSKERRANLITHLNTLREGIKSVEFMGGGSPDHY